MRDKYIEVMTAHEYRYLTTRNKKQIAQELHALRYEVAREVIEEFVEAEFASVTIQRGTSLGWFKAWLAEQGETITIDLLRRDE